MLALVHTEARISAWVFDEELALESLCLTASQAPSLGQLVGPQPTEGMSGPGFLFFSFVSCLSPSRGKREAGSVL